jgi:hypothetical protein
VTRAALGAALATIVLLATSCTSSNARSPRLRAVPLEAVAAAPVVGLDEVDPGPSPGYDPSSIDRLEVVRLDPMATEATDPLVRRQVGPLQFVDAPVRDAASLLAGQLDIPFQLYGEGIGGRRVTLMARPGTPARAVLSELCRQARCHYAYHVDVVHEEVTAGIKLTSRPYRTYGHRELGRLEVVHP